MWFIEQQHDPDQQQLFDDFTDFTIVNDIKHVPS